MQDKVPSWIQQTSIVAYEQSLSTDFDHDLWASDMVFVCEKLSCHDNQLCQINYKSHHAW